MVRGSSPGGSGSKLGTRAWSMPRQYGIAHVGVLSGFRRSSHVPVVNPVAAEGAAVVAARVVSARERQRTTRAGNRRSV